MFRFKNLILNVNPDNADNSVIDFNFFTLVVPQSPCINKNRSCNRVSLLSSG